MRDPGPDEHVGDPAVVGCRGLIAAEGLGLGGQRLAAEAPACELLAHRALGHADPVTGQEDPGDLGGRAARAARGAGRPPRRRARGGPAPPRCQSASRGEGLRGRPGARPGSSGRWWPGCSGAPSRRDGCALVRRWPAPARPVRPVPAGRSPPRRSPPSGAGQPPLLCRSSMSSLLSRGRHGTGGMKRRLPTTR